MLHPAFDLPFPVLWPMVAVCVLLTVFAAMLRSAWGKGQLGEWQVRRMRSRAVDTSVYTALHNVTLKMIDGNSTQIDHLVVSRFGVFAIETKNMKGRIKGSKHAAQ